MIKVPLLRFPQFDDEWQTKKLGEIASDVMYGLNSSAIEYDGTHKYIRITDIEETSREFRPNPLTSPNEISHSKYKLKVGDILFTRTGASVGKSYFYKRSDGELYFAGFLIKFHIPQENYRFIFAQTLLYRYYKWVKINSMRSGQEGINAEEYKSFPIFLPSLPEQEKIANFLSAVDEKIAAMKRKVELLEQFKKGVMQKIFSQELRFKSDDSSEFPAWQEKKLGEVGKAKTGSSNRVDSNLSGEYTFFDRSQDIRRSNTFIFDSEAVIIPGEGQNFIPKYFIGKFDLHQRSYAIIDFNSILGNFLFYYLMHNQNYLIANAVGSTVKSLRLPIINKMPINLPSLPEQEKIANFLSAIDKKIEISKASLSKAELWKKGLLQKMFV